MVRPMLTLIPMLFFAQPAEAQSAPKVTIAETNFRIAPGVIHLAAGQVVQLAFTNLSGSSHDFSAPAFFGRAQILSGIVGRGEVDLPAHGQLLVTLTPARGIYRARCTHFGHRMMGMSATIVVD
ncbi:MAG: cupredoxin domain-containing protein [Sphingomicrobium sp.]